MSELTTKQPAGTPTWIDLGIPDLDRAMTFDGALFGWEFDVGPAEFGRYTQCLLRGRPVAAIRPNPDPDDGAARRAVDAGGTSAEPYDMIYGRVANITDPFGTEFDVCAAMTS